MADGDAGEIDATGQGPAHVIHAFPHSHMIAGREGVTIEDAPHLRSANAVDVEPHPFSPWNPEPDTGGRMKGVRSRFEFHPRRSMGELPAFPLHVFPGAGEDEKMVRLIGAGGDQAIAV